MNQNKGGQDMAIPEVSVVMPCLNEEESLGFCIKKAKECFMKKGVHGEIIVADNGSTDNSIPVAIHEGARVILENRKGYGNAYKAGFKSAQGKYIIMGDSDGTYDFSLIGDFLDLLREGNDFVTGSRRLGEIRKDSMPWFHKYFGNPMLTKILNWLFKSKYTDVYCGLRGFTRKAYDLIQPISPGMEFNLELAINAVKSNLKICEIPITLSPRIGGKSKLSTFSDGWRSLRFMLLYFPGHLFFTPGFILSAIGILFLFTPLFFTLGNLWIDMKPIIMFAGSVMTILGAQIFSLGLFAKTYATMRKYEPENRFLIKFYDFFDLGKGVAIGFTSFFVGLGLCIFLFIKWINRGFTSGNNLDISMIALTLLIIGVQALFSSFYVSLLSLENGDSESNVA